MALRKTLLISGGIANLLFAAFHLAFPALFNWREALAPLPATTWAIFYSAHYTVILFLLVFACLSIRHWRQMLTTQVGRAIGLSIGLLWVWRTAAEMLLFRIGQEGAWWRALLFLALAVLYLAPLYTPGLFPAEGE